MRDARSSSGGREGEEVAAAAVAIVVAVAVVEAAEEACFRVRACLQKNAIRSLHYYYVIIMPIKIPPQSPPLQLSLLSFACS